MKTELWNIGRIQPYERNPRINDSAVDAVAKSIQEFGFRQPIVVDPEGVIVCGHTRWKAAQKLGLQKVPVHVAKDLSPAQIKAYRIADNKTASLAEWDFDLLPLELAELQGMDFDLDLTGFSADELAKLFETEPAEGLTDPDDIPEPPDEAVTQPGDLWILGEHRLLCGDSSSPEDVDRLLDGAGIHLVNTDPPYNVKVEPRSNNAIAAGLSSFTSDAAAKKLKSGQGNAAFDVARGKSKANGRHHQKFDLARHPEKAKPTQKKLRAKDRPLTNDFVSEEEFNRLLFAWFGNIARVLEPGRALYCWGGYANCANYPPVLKAAGLYFSQAIIWDKQHPVLTRKDFMGAHEWCFYCWKEGAAHQFFGPNNVPDIWSVKDAYFGKAATFLCLSVALLAQFPWTGRQGEVSVALVLWSFWENNKMKKAYGYLRVSTEEQFESGLGLAAQRERIAAYCQLQGLELAECFEDAGISGGRPLHLRPAGKRLLALVRRKGGIVITARLDRLFRSVADAAQTIAGAWNWWRWPSGSIPPAPTAGPWPRWPASSRNWSGP